jgi:hypothetical protein
MADGDVGHLGHLRRGIGGPELGDVIIAADAGRVPGCGDAAFALPDQGSVDPGADLPLPAVLRVRRLAQAEFRHDVVKIDQAARRAQQPVVD